MSLALRACYLRIVAMTTVVVLLAATLAPTASWSLPVKKVRLAVCQILIIDGDREGNFRRIEYALEEAQAQHADIALFPESSLFGWENPEARSMAQPIPGADSNRIAELARKYQLMIAIGIDEKDGDKLYDSAILVDSSGRILWKHRKINVLPGLMRPPYAQGRPEDIGVVDTRFGKLAVLICADTFTDSHFKRLIALKPDLLLVPYGWAAPNNQWPGHSKDLEDLVKRRASELRVPVAGADLVGEMTHGPWKGQTYGGSSFVSDGTGTILLSLRDRDTDVKVIELVIGRS